MTTTNDPVGRPHPEDLLTPYALDTLTDGEILQVESHLDVCSLCREEVAHLLQTTTLLSEAVGRQVPPSRLESRLMAAVSRTQAQTTVPAPVAPTFGFRFPWPKVLAPAAATVVVLLAASLVMNFRYFGQVDKLNEDNTNLAARLFQFSTEDTKLLDFLEQEELASYLMDNPSNEPLLLAAPGGGDPQGVLLLGEDSRHAILLVSGMPQEALPNGYQVWLLRPDQRVRMGQVQVDSWGRGTMSFYYPPESVLRFDKVVLSRDGVTSGEAASRDMVLEGSFASLKSSK